MTRETRVVFAHPSDELYGVDRMLLLMVDAAVADADVESVEVWLPTDLPHPPPELSLCHRLEERGATVRHLDLPVLRRAYATPSGLLALLRRGARLLGELRRSRATVVCCTSSATLLVAPIARAARVPSVVGQLQEVWGRSDTLALAGPGRCCHRLVAVSQAVVDTLPTGLQARTTVIHNGTREPAEVHPLEGRSGPLNMVVASRWNSGKGHQTLLDAWQAAGTDASLVVLGGQPRSGDRVDVAELARDRGLSDAVRVVGDVDDPGPWMEAADVVLVPSDRPEGFGLVAIEGFARARPVVASDAGGLAEVVTDGVDGWSYPAGDSAALATVLRGLDREQVEAAGERARATYEARFTERTFASRWLVEVLGAHR